MKEHSPKDVIELAKLADRYQDGHGWSTHNERNCKDRKFKENVTREGSGSIHDKSLSSVKCFNCQGKGHIAKDCPSPKAKQQGKKTSAGLQIKSKVSRTEQSQKQPKVGLDEDNSVDTLIVAICVCQKILQEVIMKRILLYIKKQ